ncbi:hypothetical protein Pmani_015125 [Petrolisthes manimaculis]|uniref:Uncharacterized protein n=1 Tax=Petrolisthes manimaculis TaxID=1843537 RepID=A0AAE1PSU9_9EUCA|nr:hypothetical protein Pmani_015125 [Petrolisthes manimaculis]
MGGGGGVNVVRVMSGDAKFNTTEGQGKCGYEEDKCGYEKGKCGYEDGRCCCVRKGTLTTILKTNYRHHNCLNF